MLTTQRRHGRRHRARGHGLRGARLLPVSCARAVSIHEPRPAHLGAGTEHDPWLVVEGWLAVPRPHGHELLMLRRAPDQGGFWQSVSGRVEHEDVSLAAALLREIAEETGLSPEGVELIDMQGATRFVGPVSQRWFVKHVIGVLLPPATLATPIRLSDEHVEHRFASFPEAMQLVPFTGMRTEIERLARHLRPRR